MRGAEAGLGHECSMAFGRLGDCRSPLVVAKLDRERKGVFTADPMGKFAQGTCGFLPLSRMVILRLQ